MVTVDPVAEVVTFVPPVKVIVPLVVIAVVDPESAPAVTLVTVPPESLSVAHSGAVSPEFIFKTWPEVPFVG